MILSSDASVVQLDRAIDFGSISWGFESLRTHIPSAPLAQLAEHLTLNQAVEGSIPSRRITSPFGRVLELVDKIDLGSIGVIPREGSSPFSPTKNKPTHLRRGVFFIKFTKKYHGNLKYYGNL